MSLFSGKPQLAKPLRLIGLSPSPREHPTNWRGLDAEHIILDTNRKIGIVITGVFRQKMLSQNAAILHDAQRLHISFLDERKVIGPQTHPEDPGKLRIRVARITRQRR